MYKPYPFSFGPRRAGRVLRIGLQQNLKVAGGFTLTELLTVIVVMALLVSLGLPSIMSSYRASGLTAAGNQLDSLAMLARENAVSHNVRTALVLVTSNSANPSLSGRAVSVWEMGSDQTWTQTGRWMFLPAATRAYDDPSATVTGFPTPAPTITLNGSAVPAGNYSAFIFNPEGNMYGPPSTKRVASIEYATDPAPVGSVNTSLKNYYDLVFGSDTGAIYVVRR
jgi:prepilin-type N-terminal cleavage/methylation domain-containing protein